ncbi:hypothetical protein [Anaerohalosphaera lusitana]|uniref:hypothetical protein n=1 Tax=Anaerohalosphaera lusitana TaxID=1936003 RepID=UPI0011BADCFF|nr:hypothetical protein [Anaerohalosphaera lusitana]
MKRKVILILAWIFIISGIAYKANSCWQYNQMQHNGHLEIQTRIRFSRFVTYAQTWWPLNRPPRGIPDICLHILQAQSPSDQDDYDLHYEFGSSIERGVLLDDWGRPACLEILSPENYQLISSGPNGKYEKGEGDDILYEFNPHPWGDYGHLRDAYYLRSIDQINVYNINQTDLKNKSLAKATIVALKKNPPVEIDIQLFRDCMSRAYWNTDFYDWKDGYASVVHFPDGKEKIFFLSRTGNYIRIPHAGDYVIAPEKLKKWQTYLKEKVWPKLDSLPKIDPNPKPPSSSHGNNSISYRFPNSPAA